MIGGAGGATSDKAHHSDEEEMEIRRHIALDLDASEWTDPALAAQHRLRKAVAEVVGGWWDSRLASLPTM